MTVRAPPWRQNRLLAMVDIMQTGEAEGKIVLFLLFGVL